VQRVHPVSLRIESIPRDSIIAGEHCAELPAYMPQRRTNLNFSGNVKEQWTSPFQIGIGWSGDTKPRVAEWWWMDRIDWKILSELEGNARVSFAELGDRVGLSKSPCWNRVRDLQHNGAIQSFGARLDPEALGLGVQCYISITIKFDAHTAFEAAVIGHPAIFECHTTAGASDYLLRVYARSVEHLDDLLRHEISKLPGVSASSTTICLKTIKSQASLAQWAAGIGLPR